jgi:hypothetical protein
MALPWYLLVIAFCILAIISALSVALLHADDQIDKVYVQRDSMVVENDRLSETASRQLMAIETVFSVSSRTSPDDYKSDRFLYRAKVRAVFK